MHFWHRVFGRFRRGSKMTKKPVRNQTEPAISDPPPPRAGGKAASVSKLLEPTVPITISEMQLAVPNGSAYGFGSDMGRRPGGW